MLFRWERLQVGAAVAADARKGSAARDRKCMVEELKSNEWTFQRATRFVVKGVTFFAV